MKPGKKKEMPLRTRFRTSLFVVLIVQCCLLSSCNNEDAEADLLIDNFLQKHHYFNASEDVYGSYKLNFGVEAMITYSIISGKQDYIPDIERFFLNRGYEFDDTVPYHSIPFSDPFYAFYLLRNDVSFTAPYVYECKRMFEEVSRTKEGAICIHHEGRDAVLIDYLQDYASRMARLGMITGNEAYYEECVSQFEIYRQLLRDEQSGLYSQGRGWLEDTLETSPGAWSRGQGWLIRGMVNSLECIPCKTEAYDRLQEILAEFADALLCRQDEAGMWHTLPHLDFESSEPEVSGTSMISYYIAKAVNAGMLKGSQYTKAAIRAERAIHQYIDNEGNILNVSPGPGPLREIQSYRLPGKTNDGHGFPAVLLGLSGRFLVEE